ncbi:MAG: cysteine protease [Thelocarpon superellum]|nr:MAG: cysteine protease [Thelocarpon superellum]
MRSGHKMDLVQDATSDCSVVASLCAIVGNLERGYPEIMSNLLYPYDVELKLPKFSRSGRYVLRLHFNGCYRRVVVDDRLPSSRTSRRLHVVDRNNDNLLWPALVEKAYLKMRGGYDFPGSNSGTDIWVMTGWIPEQVFLQREDVEVEKLWKSITTSFEWSDVLVTLGTGRMTPDEEEELGLASEHDYTVLSIQESGPMRRLLVKNPWIEGTVWKGRPRDKSSSDPKALDECDGVQKALADEPLAPGTFWIDLDSVLQYFESIYLNWNPALYQHRQDIHFFWDLSTETQPPNCIQGNPQYAINSVEGGASWLLLSRHFKSAQDESDSTQDTAGQRPPGYISLCVFERDGNRVLLSDGALHRGPYVDSPQTLIQLDLSPKKTYTVVVCEQSLPRTSYTFTLSVLSRKPVSIHPARDPYTHTTSVDSEWTSSNAGGNTNHVSYPRNPQFKLQLLPPPSATIPSATTDMTFLLEASNHAVPVHVTLVWGRGKRITSLSTRDIVGDSGDYRRGCALALIRNVQPGLYTVVCSTFDTGQLASFSLRTYSQAPCHVQLLPPEGAGLYRTRLPPAVFPLCASPSSSSSMTTTSTRLRFPIALSRLTRLQAVARQQTSPSRAPTLLKLTLELSFSPPGSGRGRNQVLASSSATSGGEVGSVAGLAGSIARLAGAEAEAEADEGATAYQDATSQAGIRIREVDVYPFIMPGGGGECQGFSPPGSGSGSGKRKAKRKGRYDDGLYVVLHRPPLSSVMGMEGTAPPAPASAEEERQTTNNGQGREINVDILSDVPLRPIQDHHGLGSESWVLDANNDEDDNDMTDGRGTDGNGNGNGRGGPGSTERTAVI